MRAQERSPARLALRHRETVEQLVREDAPVGGPPRAHVDLGNAPNILASGLSDLHRVDALESTRVSAPEMRPS